MGKRTNEASFSHGQDNGSGTNRGHQFTTGELAEVYGWRGAKPMHGRRPGGGLAKAQPASLGNMELGRISDFVDGLRDGRDRRAKTALEMGAVFVGVRALQHWRQ